MFKILKLNDRKKKRLKDVSSRRNTRKRSCKACIRAKKRCVVGTDGICTNCKRRGVECIRSVDGSLNSVIATVHSFSGTPPSSLNSLGNEIRSKNNRREVGAFQAELRSQEQQHPRTSSNGNNTDQKVKEIQLLPTFGDTDWLDIFLDENATYFDLAGLSLQPNMSTVNNNPTSSFESSNLLKKGPPIKSLEYHTYGGMHYGLLGEYDPILRRRFFRYNDSNECYFPTKFFRLISDNRTSPGVSSLPPFVNNALFAYKKTSVAIRENYKFLTPGLDLDDYLSRANLLYPHIPSIVILYVKHILASLPIIDGSTINEFLADPSGKISRSETEFKHPLWLLLMYKIVYPYVAYDTTILQFGVDILKNDPLAFIFDDSIFFSVAYYEIIRELSAPTLVTIKCMILFYHMYSFKRGGYITPFESSFLSMMTSLAFSFGLELDCANWNIPKYEKNLRMRIWYIIQLLENWNKVASSLPSSIAVPFSLSLDRTKDIFDDIDDVLDDAEGFWLSVDLTRILDNFAKQVLSHSRDSKELQQACDVCSTELGKWDENYENAEFDEGFPYQSIRLAYFVLSMLLNRVKYQEQAWDRCSDIYYDKCMSLFKEMVTFLQSLSHTKVRSFWYNFSRSQFMYFRDLMLICMFTADNKEQSLTVFTYVKKFKGWLESYARELAIILPALIRINITLASLGKQVKTLRDEEASALYN